MSRTLTLRVYAPFPSTGRTFSGLDGGLDPGTGGGLPATGGLPQAAGSLLPVACHSAPQRGSFDA